MHVQHVHAVAARGQPREAVQGASAEIEQVAGDHDGAVATRALGELVEAGAEARLRVLLRRGGKRFHQHARVAGTTACRQGAQHALVKQGDTRRIALAQQYLGRRAQQRGAIAHLAGHQLGSAVGHGAGHIERQHRPQLRLVLEVLHAMVVTAGEGAPVDGARVVAGAVGAVLGEDQSATTTPALVQAGVQAVDHSFHGKAQVRQALDEGGVNHPPHSALGVAHGLTERAMLAMMSPIRTPSASARKLGTSR